jgi:hypothetical protein
MSMNIQIIGISDVYGVKTPLDVIQTTTEETYDILDKSTWQERRDRYIQCLNERFEPNERDFNMRNPYEAEEYKNEVAYLQEKINVLNSFDRLEFQMI